MFFWRLKKAVSVIVTAILAVGIFVCARFVNVTKFGGYAGVRAYYLDSATSQGLQKERLLGLECFRVQGESVYVAGADEEFVDLVLQEYTATVLWIEEVCDVVSYYCYTPAWHNGVMINGQKVNLHIALSKEGCALGSPIIFGGY